MNYLLGLPTKRQAERMHLLLGGKNIEKERETRNKNRKRRKNK